MEVAEEEAGEAHHPMLLRVLHATIQQLRER